MKRIAAVFIALMMLAAGTAAAENENFNIPFECGLTSSVVPDTAAEIIESSLQRAFITVCLWLDFGISDEGKDFMAENFGTLCINDSYVASDGELLVLVTGYASGKQLHIFYNVAEKEASYALTEADFPDEIMKDLVKSSAEFFTLNYKNNASDLEQVLSIIQDAVKGS